MGYASKFVVLLTCWLKAGAKVSHSRPKDLRSRQLRMLKWDHDGVAVYVAGDSDWGCPERQPTRAIQATCASRMRGVKSPQICDSAFRAS